MALPASFRTDGFGTSPSRPRGVMIGTEGRDNTGKTEFAWSAPAYAIHLAVDMGYMGCRDSVAPPKSRYLYPGENMAVEEITAPLNTGVTQTDAQNSWREFYQGKYLKALHNRDVTTVILDGDSDTFEWQTLAEFGRTNSIMQLSRTPLNAARRVMISRAVNSGKIFLATNKVKRKYETVYDANGNPIPDPQKAGQNLREWDGKSFERQGFNDYEYGYEIQLRHVRDDTRKPGQQFGITIMMCKSDMKLKGRTLWGDECNMATLFAYAFPNIDMLSWGWDEDYLKALGVL